MASISLELLPFDVPTTVAIKLPPLPAGNRSEGLTTARAPATLQIADLQPEVLDTLIEEFVAALYKQAGRE